MTMISSRYSEDSSIHSDLDSLSSGCSIQLKSPISSRHDHQRPTIASRRQSRLLYAEKYGLTSPDWCASSIDGGNDSGNSSCVDEDENKDDNLDDLKPTPLQRRSYSLSAATLCGRPRSLFNLSQPSTTTLRPAAFVKPTTATSFGTPPSTVPSDMINIQRLYEQYHRKVYMEGFVVKRNQCNSDGSLCQDDCWSKVYVELSGPILSLWDGDSLKNNGTSGTILPHYINISDATANLVNDNNNDDTVMVILNTAGRNQYLIRPEPPTLSSAQHWVTAIRLSCFECARLFEIYTRYLLLRPTYLQLWRSMQTSSTSTRTTLTAKPSKSIRRHRTEGFLQARFAGDTEWKRYWAVACDQREEKRLFGKAKSVPCRGQLMFYKSKKAKYPSVTLVDIAYAYTLYPQSPQLIDLSTIFKVEGTVLPTTTNGKQPLTNAPSGTLLMTSTTKEMMQWLVGIFAVFKLYGQPTCLLDDPLNPKALNFGETAAINDDDDSDGLFLENTDVIHLSVGQDETLRDSKMAFTDVLAQKLKKFPMDASTPVDGASIASAKPPLYAVKPRANSAPLLADITCSSLVDHSVAPLTESPTLMPTLMPPTPSQPNQRASTVKVTLGQSRTMAYASDVSDSDSEEDIDGSDSEQSDVNSIFIDTSTPQLTAAHTEKELLTPSEPTTPSPSPSLHHPSDSNKILSPVDDDYQGNQDNVNASGDMLGFAKSLLSRTFGMDPTTLASTNASSTTGSSLISQPPSTQSVKPVEDSPSFASTTSLMPSNKQPPPSKRISTRPLSSDGEESDGEDVLDSTDDDDDDEPIHTSAAFNKMKITTPPSSSPRSPSTVMSVTASTPGSNRFSVATGSYDTSSSNTSVTTSAANTRQHPQHAKVKRHSVLSPQPMKSSSTSSRQQSGLVHKVDYMQQQQELQQSQDHQPLWETGSFMETDPRYHAPHYRLPQQQQQQQPVWETGSVAGSVSNPDPRIAMYHHAGSVYGGGNLYSGSSPSVCGGSVYGEGFTSGGGSVYGVQSGASVYGGDYQRMMPMGQPLVQMDVKPSEPRSGLIGMISQMEDDKREKDKNKFPMALSPQQQQQQLYQNQLLYQQQLLQQHQMMMNSPYMMNPMMANPMMMNPMMMNPTMMMMMMQQQQQQQQQQQWPPMNNSGYLYQQRPLMEDDGEEDEDDAPLGRPSKQQATMGENAPLSRAQQQAIGGV